MAKYKVTYSGFAYVEADSENEAMVLYDSDAIYSEEQVDEIRQVEDCVVDFR